MAEVDDPITTHVSPDPEDDEDEEEDIEDLLFSSQMDFIGHHPSRAIAKLHRAVTLGSSAACATLGSLLSRGLREPSPTSPSPRRTMSDPFTPRQHPSPTFGSDSQSIANGNDLVEAANLYVTGLRIELAKAVLPSTRPNSASISRYSSSKRGHEASFSASEGEDSAEGVWFSLERTLDLIVGLTDCYRYGVLQPVGSAASSSQDITQRAAQLWGSGADVAEEALGHPGMAPRFSQSSPLHPEQPSLVSHRGVSRGSASARPLNSSPSADYTSIAPGAHLTPHLKHRLTIQIHILYLLALQKYSSDRPLSERYWAEIIRLAAQTGGVVGTKEGNEIVEKATRRLQMSEVPDWKLSKRRDSALSTSSLPKQSPIENLATRRSKGGLSGDALVDMWYERTRSKEKEWDIPEHGERLDEDADSDLLASTITVRPRRDASTTSTETIRPQTTTAPTLIRSPSSGKSCNDHELQAALAAVPRSIPRAAKFHFATTVDYPSPPDTPLPSPPATADVSHLTDNVSSPTLVSPPRPGVPPPRLRRLPSTSSFQAPSLPRLLRRAESSTSVSTLPPDFFSSKTRNPANTRDWRSSSHPTTSAINFQPPDLLPMTMRTSSEPVGWSTSFWHGVSSLRSTSSRVASNLNPFKPQPPKTPSAIAVLSQVLDKDDESAGPGMYWADSGEDIEENEEQQDIEGVINSSAEAHPPGAVFQNRVDAESEARTSYTSKSTIRLAPRAHRSFVDVTSAPVATCTPYPKVVCTPPTPVKTPSSTQDPLSRSSSHHNKALENHGINAIDPLLLELERRSRVGVKTVCRTCRKQGLNFPAVRTGDTYCSRDCRLGTTFITGALPANSPLAEAVAPSFP